MADKYYTTGDGRMIEAPLLFLIGASNEYPTGTYAEPYLDRLLFWYDVSRIKNTNNRLKFFNSDFNREIIEEPIFLLEEIEDTYIKSQESIIIPEDMLHTLNEIINDIIVQGVKTSDRKYFNAIKAMKVSAFINERESIDNSDLFLLLFSAWHNDVEKRKVEDVLFYKMFSNETKLQGYIKDIKDDFEKNDTFIKGELYDFINHIVSFLGDNAAKNYRSYTNAIVNCMIQYEKIHENLQGVKVKLESIYVIENQISENIFLEDFKNSSITKEILDDIENYDLKISSEWNNLKIWIMHNEKLVNYNKNKQGLNIL